MCDTHRDALSECLGRGTVGDVAAHEHEPFWVHVRDDVTRAGDRSEPGRDRLDEVRAGLVAETFVHVREVVELDRDDRDAPERDLAIGEPPAEAVEVEHRDTRLSRVPPSLTGARLRASFDGRRSGSGLRERE